MKRLAIEMVALCMVAAVACDREKTEDSPPAMNVPAPGAMNEGTPPHQESYEGRRQPVAGESAEEHGTEETAEQAKEAAALLSEASQMVQKMKSDPKLSRLVRRAEGVFLVPRYGRGAVGIGARGGEGVVLIKRDDGWSSPGFYDLGGISVGIQLGGEGGEIAMLLMSKKAVDAFKHDNSFALNADAGFATADYSAMRGSSTKGTDVVLWSSTRGAFAGATIGVTDISWDDDENAAFYGKKVTPESFIGGSLSVGTVPLQEDLKGL